MRGTLPLTRLLVSKYSSNSWQMYRRLSFKLIQVCFVRFYPLSYIFVSRWIPGLKLYRIKGESLGIEEIIQPAFIRIICKWFFSDRRQFAFILRRSIILLYISSAVGGFCRREQLMLYTCVYIYIYHVCLVILTAHTKVSVPENCAAQFVHTTRCAIMTRILKDSTRR
jgi:hypothetical protein